MKFNMPFVFCSFCLAVVLGLIGGAFIPAAAQEERPNISADRVQITGVPDDWSHYHVIFSNPGTKEEAIRKGTYGRWLAVQNDPRFRLQQLQRHTRQLPRWQELHHGKLEKDWNVSLGAAGVAVSMYPAKYSFSINNASCSDFVVFPVNSAGAAAVAASQTGTVSGTPTTAQGQTITITNGSSNITLTGTPTAASATGTFSSEPATDSTLTIKGLGNTLILEASTSTSSSCTFSGGSSTVTFTRSGTLNTNATRLAALINTSGCGSTVGVSASAPGSGEVVITAATAGSAGNSISVQSSSSPNFEISAWTTATDLSGGLNSMTTGTYFATSSTASTEAANIAGAINTNGSTVGVSASSSGGTVTVDATAPGTAGNSITLAEAVSNFSWSSGTLAGGADGQANLVGIDNLYSGTGGSCGSSPTVLFSYQVGTGTVQTSPSLSENGTKVAYVESISSGSRFHVLTIGTTGSNGTAAISPVVPGTGNNAADTAITMDGDVSVTLSSPFIDYQRDIAYVGDDSGKLHKFTPVFNGTPAEVTTGGWPITVSSGISGTCDPVLTGPTQDYNTDNVFVADGCGVLRFVSTTADCGSTAPPCVGTTTINVGQVNGYTTASNRAITDPPVVDSSTGHVYVFIACGQDSTENCDSSNDSPYEYAYVLQATTTLASPVWTAIGYASISNDVHIGAFDNTYYAGPIQNGHLYVCGQPARNNENPMLYQIGFNSSGVMNSTAGSSTLTLADTPSGDTSPVCSPLTEIYNTTTSTDWLFLSIADYATASGCDSAGCVMNFNITSGFPTGGSSAATEESTGTSAIIVDNVSSVGQASSIYFGTLPSGSNEAIKLTQSGLD